MSFESYITSFEPFPWTIVKDHPNEWLVGNSSVAVNYVRFQLITNALEKLFKSGDKIFDVGVYPGDIPKVFKEYVSRERPYRYTGVGLGFTDEFTAVMEKLGVDLYECDLDPRINNKCERNNKIELDEEYDVCVFTDVIEHFFDPFYPLQEINKNLKVGGKLILTTDNITHFANTLSFIRGESPNVPLMSGNLFYDGDWRPHFREYSKQEIIQLLEWAGFKVDHHEYYEAHFGFYRIQNGKLGFKDYTQKGLKDKFKALVRNFLKEMFPHLKDNHFFVATKTIDYKEMINKAPKLTSDTSEWMHQRKRLQ